MIYRFILLSILFIALSPFKALGSGPQEKDKVTLRPSKTENHPNTETPVECEKDSDAGTLDFTFIEDVGDVTVEVKNIGTGERNYAKLNSAIGMGRVNITRQEGLYSVTLKTREGEFIGYFNQ